MTPVGASFKGPVMRRDQHNAVAVALEHGARVRRARAARKDHPMSGNGDTDTDIVAARMLAQQH
eukprot:9175067-Alexandrium_andersonii.AAC.1